MLYGAYLEVVIAKVKYAQGMVGAKDAAKMLAVLRTKVVAAQPQLLEVLVELHRSHWIENRGSTPSQLVGTNTAKTVCKARGLVAH